ncbi:hypothetical protein [Neolewinella persica]|uniref:hypothetical protein n=1 Tax=Neolewinella persica TaxID=70998 RepID=UPI0003A9BA4E|nr:hypothetical protein [Neolewinella persica]
MNSFQRVLLASRAAIREMPGVYYLLSSGIVLTVLFFIGLIGKDDDATSGLLYNQYTVFDADIMMGIIIIVGWLSATIICGAAFFKDFKEEDRGVRYFSLPVSNKERLASLLLVNWGFVSLISFVPPLLLAGFSWLVAPDFILFPSPQYLLPVLFVGPLVHLISSSYWMFSSIAYPKLSAIFILGFLGLAALYLSQTRNLYSDRIDIEHTTTAFDATNVVGMMDDGFLIKESASSPIPYYLEEWNTLAICLMGVCLLFMLMSMGMALNRKTT